MPCLLMAGRVLNHLMTERLLTPSKIAAFLDCAHYLTLRHQLEVGRLQISHSFGSMAQLLVDKGLAHEQACLAQYQADGKRVLVVPDRLEHESFAAWISRVGNPFTDDVDVIYQMPFVHQGVRGIADFLVRVLGHDGVTRWEPVDAKLARNEAKPGHVLQLCFYADAIEALTGVVPEHLHVWLGSDVVETVRLTDVRAYWRRLRAQLTKVMELDPADDTTVPVKCRHCQFCEFEQVCEQRWRDEDSLLFVANILAGDREALTAAGRSTMASLAKCTEAVEGVRPERQTRLVTQASLQVQRRLAGADSMPPVLHLPDSGDTAPTGFRALPAPDDGDVFLDYEGHPFWRADRGLFFLFGYLVRDPDGSWRYVQEWAHDDIAEGELTRRFIEFLVARRAAHPGMHVYHYNHTERSSLQALATQHGADLLALSTLVDTGLFVDLLRVVTDSMQVGVESYGLKHIERLTGFERGHDIDKGAGAVVEYEEWINAGRPEPSEQLRRIASYNEDDVHATLALRDWLLEQRPTELPWRVATIEQADTEHPDIDAQVQVLHDHPADSAEYLLGDLLGYWLREGRAGFGNMLVKTAYETAAELDADDIVAGLEFVSIDPALTPGGKKSKNDQAVFRIPHQRLGRKLTEDAQVVYRAGDELVGHSSIKSLDATAGHLSLTWNARNVELGVHPTAVVLNDSMSPKPKPASLSRFAAKVLAGDSPSRAALALLRRELPRFTPGNGPTDGTFDDDLPTMQQWVRHLDHSYVAIQGPPGTGKTYTGAHLIHSLVTDGKRVGITAMSHHAIDNLLDAAVELFAELGDLDRLRALRKVNEEHDQDNPHVAYTEDTKKCVSMSPGYNLIGGTTWLFANEAMQDEPLDVLIVDEAGQLSLADAVAAIPSAHSVVLLGDPLQLAQVAQGSHPGRSGASVLEHILGDDATITPDRGVFLSETWRMHPNVCGFISTQIYEGRLTSHSSCGLQNTGAGTGLRWLPAVHTGCSTESECEAQIIVNEVTRLIGQSWTNAKGETRPLDAGDIMVVAPYNDQVALVRERLAAIALTEAVRVGTVDKFQGQEAPVVFFTMTASSSTDIPRGIDFLFSKNRLNVAISRARALAYIVCTEDLLDSRAKTIDEMELIATLCTFVEHC